jgi:glycosyltransferase involved in cell wall biosynthesis
MKISHVIVTYNKENFIEATLKSVLNQASQFDHEIIVLDDNSSDATVDILNRIATENPSVNVVTDGKNKGPSIRFNQGASLATGDILHLIDGDDIVPNNFVATMIDKIVQLNIDAVFGGWKKTDLPAQELLSESFETEPEYQISDTPLDTVLSNNQVRMGMLLKRELYLKSGGCDESIFIQDESLPIRYCIMAKRIMTVKAPVILVPKGAEGLSHDKSQQHHDRFFAYYNLYTKYATELSPQTSWKLRQALISSTWKSIRKQKISLTFLRLFLSYLMSKQFTSYPSASNIKRCVNYFTQLGLTLKRPL